MIDALVSGLIISVVITTAILIRRAELNKAYMDEAEAIAMEGMKQIRAFFAYQGSDARYFQKARLGAATIGAYSRLYATQTNRMALQLAAKRVGAVSPQAKQLSE